MPQEPSTTDTERVIEVPDDGVTELQDAPIDTQQSKIMTAFGLVWVLAGALLIVPVTAVLGSWYVLNQPPAAFTEVVVEVPVGASVSTIADTMQANNVVRSDLLLELALRFSVDATKIQAGKYKFDEALTTTEVAHKLVSGELHHELVSLTFLEGTTLRDFAEVAEINLPNVTAETFLALTAGLEGKLLPETYFVPDEFTTEELVILLTDAHQNFVSKLLEESNTQLSTNEIVTLASIIEREANSPESMRTVAGIFLNRLEIGMALQADASIEYVLDTPLGQLPAGQLATELRELDSPYNTYLYPGLPPTPIGNPGTTALAAVVDPIPSDYLFYITGNDGNFYYAETYDQHLRNIETFLR